MPSGGESEFSAGGVVVRDGHCIVIVPTRRAADGSKVLVIGMSDPNNVFLYDEVRRRLKRAFLSCLRPRSCNAFLPPRSWRTPSSP